MQCVCVESVVVLCFVLCWGGWKGGGAQFKAVSEMPRSCVQDVSQATVISPGSKSSLTTSGPGARLALLNAKEQLLQEIKAKRRREMGGLKKEMRRILQDHPTLLYKQDKLQIYYAFVS